MIHDLNIKILPILIIILCQSHIILGQNGSSKPNDNLIHRTKTTSGLIALWTFKERPGKSRKAIGEDRFP